MRDEKMKITLEVNFLIKQEEDKKLLTKKEILEKITRNINGWQYSNAKVKIIKREVIKAKDKRGLIVYPTHNTLYNY